MRIRIRHQTEYRYNPAIDFGVQLIRLTPQNYDGQRVIRWSIGESGRDLLTGTDDGYGNVIHVLTLDRQHQDAVIVAEGIVETWEMHGVVAGAVERFPPLYYMRPTEITAPDADLRALAGGVANVADPVERLHALMAAVREAIAYETGATHVHTSARETLATGRGVCQDFAHVFCACARASGIPARYVSGYMRDSEAFIAHEASHAWAEAHVDGLGWVGFDPANGISPTEAYVRVAIGLDYREAAPTRGVRRGLAEETLGVTVTVDAMDGQQ